MSSGTTRRDALRLLALAIGGGAIAPALARAQSADENGIPDDSNSEAMPEEPARIGRIGVQLYTVRRLLAANIEEVIASLAAAGITELEFAGYYDKPASWWNELMKRHNMTAPATHIGLPATNVEWLPHFERSVAMGHKWVIVPSTSAEYRNADGWKRLADRLNAGGELAAKSGLRMGYHNHNYEFDALPAGTNGLETLLSNTDAGLVDFELDIYWAVKAGADPLALLTKYPQRFTCCHVKDAGPLPTREMMDVGAGTIDFRTLLATGRKGSLQHWFIEHDDPRDALASVRASAAALKTM